MTELKSCELCGTRTSGNKDERFKEYESRLIDASVVARDERSLVFIATDNISKLDSLTSSSRVLSHEDGMSFPKGRYAHAEKARDRLMKALYCIQLAVDSLDKHIEDSQIKS